MSYEGKVLSVIGIVLLAAIVGYLAIGWRGVSRSCSGCYAQAAGSNWVVVQLDLSGRPFRCWELHEVSIANETNSDGIYWEEENGNLVHVSGLYNRVQVAGDNWEAAFASLGLSQGRCTAIRNRTTE